MKYFIKTYGCQANINDSEIIAGMLKLRKKEVVSDERRADVIIINSCSVKNKTQSKIIDYISKHCEKKKIIVTGCLIKTIDLKKRFLQIEIKDLIKKRLGMPICRRDSRVGIIQIGEGCLNECTYCATRLAKGKLKSYLVKEIKKEFTRVVDEGCKMIYLTSQDNGCYGFDKKTNLAKLLKELLKFKGNYKIRVGMINPWYLMKFIDEMIDVYKDERVIKFLHIPVQSGSNKVLKEMKRGGNVDDFKKIFFKFRKEFPRQKFSDSTIATDIIVGYPTETEADFEKTLNLIKEIKPEVLNISSFSSRPRTEASKLKQLPSEIIKKRTRELNEVYRKYRSGLK